MWSQFVLAKVEVCDTALHIVRETFEEHPDRIVAELAILELDVPHGLGIRFIDERWNYRADDPTLLFRTCQGDIVEYYILPELFAQLILLNFQEPLDLNVHESAVVLEVFPEELIPDHVGDEKSEYPRAKIVTKGHGPATFDTGLLLFFRQGEANVSVLFLDDNVMGRQKHLSFVIFLVVGSIPKELPSSHDDVSRMELLFERGLEVTFLLLDVAIIESAPISVKIVQIIRNFHLFVSIYCLENLCLNSISFLSFFLSSYDRVEILKIFTPRSLNHPLTLFLTLVIVVFFLLKFALESVEEGLPGLSSLLLGTILVFALHIVEFILLVKVLHELIR